MDGQQTFEVIKKLTVNTKFILNGEEFAVCEHKRNSVRKFYSYVNCKIVSCTVLPIQAINNELIIRTTFGDMVVKNVKR